MEFARVFALKTVITRIHGGAPWRIAASPCRKSPLYIVTDKCVSNMAHSSQLRLMRSLMSAAAEAD